MITVKKLIKDVTEMKSNKKGMLIVFASTFVVAIAHFLFKAGMNNTNSLWDLINANIIVGGVFYLIGTLMMIWGLKYGEASSAYPVVASGFIWVVLMGYLFLDEIITASSIAGIILIISGIFLVGSQK